jgi:hypothetical protein
MSVRASIEWLSAVPQKLELVRILIFKIKKYNSFA